MTDADPGRLDSNGAADPVPPRSRTGGWRGMLFKVTLSALIFGFLVYSVDFARAAAVLRAVDPWLTALAVVVLATAPAVSIPRWRAILACLGHALPTSMVARTLYIGAFFNQVLPSSIGGDGWRIWYCTRAGVPLGVAANSVLIERLVGLLAVLLCFALTFPILLDRVGDDPVRWLLWLMLAGCLGIVLGLAFLGAAARRLEGIRPLRAMAALGLALSAVARSSQVILLLLTGVLGQLVAIVAFYLVSRSAGAPLSFLDCAVTLAPGLLVALVPVSLGGWGVREGAFVVLLGFYGVPPAQSLVVSVLFGLALLASSLPGLVLWLCRPAGGPGEGGPLPQAS